MSKPAALEERLIEFAVRIINLIEKLLDTKAATLATLWVLLSVYASPGMARAAEPDFDIDGFLVNYCFDCHDDLTQKGDRRLDDLDLVIGDVPMAHRWQEVLDVLALGEMPPEDEPQPAPEERLAATDHLRTMLAEAAFRLEGQSETVVMRRLNRIEYRNTMRDLFGFVAPHFDPSRHLPADEEDEGFFTIGETLMTSPLWLEGTLNAAAEAIDRALAMGGEKPEPRHHTIDAMTFRTGGGRTSIKPEAHLQCMTLFSRSTKISLGMSEAFAAGVPASGLYDIEIDAAAVGRENLFPDRVISPMDKDEPFLLAVGADIYDPTPNGNTQGTPRTLALIPLEDDHRQTYRTRVWLEAGESPSVLFWNGPGQNRNFQMLNLMSSLYPDRVPENWKGIDIRDLTLAERVEVMASDLYPGPRIRVWEIRLHGPHCDKWPALAHQRLFGKLGPNPDDAALREQITSFTRLAWRREPEPAEIDRLLAMTRKRIAAGMDPKEALRLPYKFVLTNPAFLYLLEPVEDEAAPRLASAQLASRLSYFLSSHPPDEALRSADLTDPKIRQQQIERLLDHERIAQLAANFTEQWLHLHDLGKMPPDDRTFQFYHEERLQEKMKRETALLFREAVGKNLTLRDLLTAGHTWVDRPLAKHYGLDFTHLKTDQFQRVALPPTTRRRGLLGHSSILTVTSNGVETSPVVRGVWLLENILGTPPPPPPPDVPPLEPDIRGATTIREQLAKHRSIETCAACHAKIDPLGFALENFDPIGLWRGRYPNQAAIDPATEYKGTAIQHHDDLVAYLVAHEGLVARCLMEKMFTYALGRHLTFADKSELNRIETEWKKRGHGLRDLVRLVAGSELMAKR